MESTTTRKTFAFNTVWYEIIAGCSAQVKGEVFASVMDYALYGKLPENICNEANVIFQFIKIEIDRREKRRQRYHSAKTTSSTDKSAESESSDNSENSENPETPSTPILTRQLRRKLKREEEKLLKRKMAS